MVGREVHTLPAASSRGLMVQISPRRRLTALQESGRPFIGWRYLWPRRMSNDPQSAGGTSEVTTGPPLRWSPRAMLYLMRTFTPPSMSWRNPFSQQSRL
jgi:hypothetical protein